MKTVKNYFGFILLLSILSFNSFVYSQSSLDYTYKPESFEDSVWAFAGTVNAATGTWSTASSNTRSSAVTAQDGSYSIVMANKSGASVTTPRLINGAGILTFYAQKTSSSRTFSILTSTDGATYTQFGSTITLADINMWKLQSIVINDAAVRYIRITVNSNGSSYIDNFLVTPAGAQGVTVATSAAVNITQTTALTGGTITLNGAINITERGVCYNTTGMPDTSSLKVISQTSVNVFSCQLINLNSNVKYYIRAYAVSSGGVTYGEEISFTTLISAPPVAYWTQNFNDQSQLPSANPSVPVEINVAGQGTWIFLGAYKATNASYICDGSAIDLRITKNNSYVVTPVLDDGVTAVTFTEGRGDRNLSVYKSTDAGSSWLPVQTVTTIKCTLNSILINDASVNRIKIANENSSDADIDNLTITAVSTGIVPTVVTKNEVTNISKNGAAGGGEVTAQGTKAVLERGVCWSTASLPTTESQRTIDGSGLGVFESRITGLAAGTKYFLRAYAVSRSGAAYGNEISFTTLNASLPVLKTKPAANIIATSAVSGGTITDGGGADITACGVCWNLTGNPLIIDSKTSDNISSGTFTSTLQNLIPNTKYYFCAYAVNSVGIGYGNVDSLTTSSAALPVVATNAVTNIKSVLALCGGSITSAGNATITACGVCWNTSGSPDTSDNKTIDTASGNSFNSTIINLKPSTRYYVRAYAANISGISYGGQITFTTAARAVYYISAKGNDVTGTGTADKPFYSLQKGIDLADIGDSICITGGIYNYTSRVNIDKNGDVNGFITIAPPKGERAVLDFSAMALNTSNQGIRITGSYWHLYGLDIKGAGDNGILIERDKPSGGTYTDVKDKTAQAHNNIIEFCAFYENRDAGVQLKNLASYNKFINCDAYFNRDPDEGDADGFAPKLTVGTGNYFYGCRSWQNSDDGFDLYLKCAEEGFPQDMVTTIENCWCFMNGFLKDGTAGSGNGNGFKLGGSDGRDQRHDVILIRCLSFDNLQKGFDQNNNVGSMTLINCTGFAKPYLNNSNHYTYKIDGTTLAPGKKFTHTNCVAVWDGVTDAKKSKWAPCDITGGVKTTCNYLTTEADYITIDTTGVRGARKADGSLPDINFMHIKNGNTSLIDAGTILPGLLYAGSAPDLGAFETGIINNVKEIQNANTFLLDQNYPNPFNPTTTIKYSIPHESKVTLTVYNSLGQKIKELVNQTKQAGNYEVVFNASGMPSGVYFYVLNTGEFTQAMKLLLLK